MNRWQRRRLAELPWWKLMLIEALRFFLAMGLISLWAFMLYLAAI